MSTEVEQSILEKIQALSLEQQSEVLEFIEKLMGHKHEDALADPDQRPIWEVIKEISDSVPEEAWNDVPTDGSINVDHYLYGAPKRES